MKKQLIAVGLAGLLTIPAVSFGAEMAGPGLYGSFRTGLSFGSGDASVADIGSRWGFKGSHEVSEGLTASYKYESKFNTTNAESSGGAGHKHAEVAGGDAIAGLSFHEFVTDAENNTFTPEGEGAVEVVIDPKNYVVGATMLDTDEDGNATLTVMNEKTYATVTTPDDPLTENQDESSIDYFEVASSRTTHGHAANAGTDADGGPGGRLSYISLTGGFGTISLGQIWSASGVHYGFKVDPSYWNGVFGGANYRNGNSISYSSNAGDVTFQIDKVTGDAGKLELGASADLGPVAIGVGNWSNANDDAGFTGVAVAAGAAGVNLTVGLGSSKDALGVKSKQNVLLIGGSFGDSGLSYAVQIANSDKDDGVDDQNLIVMTNSLGSGASLIFEHVSHGDKTKDASSLLALKVDF